MAGDVKKYWMICRISLRPFVVIVKASQPASPKTLQDKGEIMPQYLLANYLPDNFDPSTMTEATVRAINDLNEELEAAGARLMACGLSPASQAKSVRGQPNGEALITDGPYLEAKEHIGGFWILEAADMDEALEWARKAAFDPQSRGEVREIPYSSLEGGTPHPSRQHRVKA
jgi:hypothetical protein